MRLYEILDKPLPYKKIKSSTTSTRCETTEYSFSTNTMDYMVSIIVTPGEIGSFAFIAFATKPHDDDYYSETITANNEEFVVFSTVGKIIKDNTNQIDNIFYSAAEDEANSSRKSLYAKLAKYCFKKSSVEVEFHNGIGSDTWYIVAKKEMPSETDILRAYNALLQL